ncbi:hypothetical protein AMECASPLE_038106 [Ameca splendens]|uniref:Uncharacterized protein n=1 Tax=Ameca splendens TaxID=208324 RepID=A0ABV0Z5Z6_9TELE
MAQDTLEGLCPSTGLGMPWTPPGEAGGGVWGEGHLGVSAEFAAPVPDKRKTTSTSTSKTPERILKSFNMLTGLSDHSVIMVKKINKRLWSLAATETNGIP